MARRIGRVASRICGLSISGCVSAAKISTPALIQADRIDRLSAGLPGCRGIQSLSLASSTPILDFSQPSGCVKYSRSKTKYWPVRCLSVFLCICVIVTTSCPTRHAACRFTTKIRSLSVSLEYSLCTIPRLADEELVEQLLADLPARVSHLSNPVGTLITAVLNVSTQWERVLLKSCGDKSMVL